MSSRPHARRCCALCRQRKTRCELPTASLLLPAGPDPLPTHHACHRCIVLSVECILLPAQAKRKKKSRPRAVSLLAPSVGEQDWTQSPSLDFPGSASTAVSRVSSPPPPLINHDLPILRTFRVAQENDVESPEPRERNSMRYHGRPLELSVVMLRMAISGKVQHKQRVESAIDWDEELLDRLEPGRLQLLSTVPYVLPLETLYLRHTREHSIPDALLLFATAYLSALALRSSERDARLLDDLADGVATYCELLYLSQTPTISAVQALDLLANFAPLGSLPCRSASSQKLVVARGHITNALFLAHSIGLHSQTKSEIWTWLSVCATSATYRLEDYASYDCPEIFQARMLSDAVVETLSFTDEPQCIAQWLLCERIARLAIVFDALTSFKNAVQSSIHNMFYDAQSAIVQTLSIAKQCFGATDERYKHLHRIADHSIVQPVGATPFTIRRLFEEGKVQRCANISLIAAALIQESLVDLNDGHQFLMCTPEELKQKQYESAMTLASDPHNIAEWFRRNRDSYACCTINTWARDRIEGIEEMFVAFGALDPSSDPPLAPWQFIASILVEGSNVLLDLQAAHLVNTGSVYSRRQAHTMSRRAYMMRQVSRTLRSMEGTRSNTVSAMCSDLIGSMARIYENRAARLQKGSEIESSSSNLEALPMLESDYDVLQRLCAFLNEPNDTDHSTGLAA